MPQTSIEQELITFEKGMLTEVTPQAYPSGFYTFGQNMRLRALNKKDSAVSTTKGQKIFRPLNPLLQALALERVIGMERVGDKIVYFIAKSVPNSVAASFQKNAIVIFDTKTEATSVLLSDFLSSSQVYADAEQLNFDRLSHIQTAVNGSKVYFVDGINRMRF